MWQLSTVLLLWLSISSAYVFGLSSIGSAQSPYSLRSPRFAAEPPPEERYVVPLASWVTEPLSPSTNASQQIVGQPTIPNYRPSTDLRQWSLLDDGQDPHEPHADVAIPSDNAQRTAASHELSRSADIILDFNLWREGAPDDLLMEFTSPAGSALRLAIDRYGLVTARTASDQLTGDLTDNTHRITVHLRQSPPGGFEIFEGSSSVLSGPLDSGISDVNRILISASGSGGTWHLAEASQRGQADSVLAHHMIPESRIQTVTLDVRAVGTPQELQIEFRSVAGTSLELGIDRNGLVRSGTHLVYASPAAWFGSDVHRLTVHINASRDIYTFSLFHGDELVISAPLPRQLSNTNEVRIASATSVGRWEVQGGNVHLADTISISTAAPGFPTSAGVQLTRRIDEFELTFSDGAQLTQPVERVSGQTVRVSVSPTSPPITRVRTLPLGLEWAASVEDGPLVRGMTLALLPNPEAGIIGPSTGRGLAALITIARAVALFSTVLALGDVLTKLLFRRLSSRTHTVASLMIGVVALAGLGIPHLIGPDPIPEPLRLAIAIPIGTFTLWWVTRRALTFVSRARLWWVLAAAVAVLFQVIAISIVASWDELRHDSNISQFEGDYLVPYTMAQDLRHQVPLDDADVWGFPFGSRTPLFPITYLGSMVLFGNESLRGTSFLEPPTRWQPDGATIYMVVVAVTTAILAVMVGLLAESWLGTGTGDLASALVAMNPMLTWIALLSPYRPLMVVFLLGASYLLSRPRSLSHDLLGGLAAAAAYATGRIALPFIPGLLLLPWSSAGGMRRRFGVGLAAIALVAVVFVAWMFVSRSNETSSEWGFLLPLLTETHRDELRTQEAGEIWSAFLRSIGDDPFALVRERLLNLGRVMIPGLFLNIQSFNDGVVRLHTFNLLGLTLLPLGLAGIAGLGLYLRRSARQLARVGMLASGFVLVVFVVFGSDSPALLVAVGLPLAALLTMWAAFGLRRWPRLGLLVIVLAAVEAALVAYTFWGALLVAPAVPRSVIGVAAGFSLAWIVAASLAGRALLYGHTPWRPESRHA